MNHPTLRAPLHRRGRLTENSRINPENKKSYTAQFLKKELYLDNILIK